MAELARTRHDEESPLHLTGPGIESHHPALSADITIRDADKHLAARVHGRGRHRLARRRWDLSDRRRPDQFAVFPIERDNFPAPRAEKDPVTAHRDALPRRHSPRLGIRLPVPDWIARPRIEREDVRAPRQVDDAVLHHRGCARRGAAGKRSHPRRTEAIDGVGRHRVEGGVARAGPVTAGEGPVGGRIAAAWIGGLPGEAAHQQQDRDHRCRNGDDGAITSRPDHDALLSQVSRLHDDIPMARAQAVQSCPKTAQP